MAKKTPSKRTGKATAKPSKAIASTKKPSKKPASTDAAQPTSRISWMMQEPEIALDLMVSLLRPVTGLEKVYLLDSIDRVVGADIKSPLTLPPVDRSERDGYAVRASDCRGDRVKLRQVGIATAGNPAGVAVGEGECLRIATGSVLPKGADSVVMFEDTADDHGQIYIKQPVKSGQWVATVGSDIAKGATIVAAGDVLSPPKIAALSALGLSEVKVLRRPTALVYTTGDEVRSPGEKLRAGDVYDGNTVALTALLRQNGIDAIAGPKVEDTLAAQTKALKAAAAKYDLVVFSGGTSVGDHDFGRRALDAVGETLIHGVNLKPGKPLLFGLAGGTKRVPVFGLPGFPVSAMMLAYVFLIPASHRIAGYPQPYEAYENVPLGEAVKADPHKMFVIPVKINDHGEAVPTFRSSAEISSIASADGYITLPAGDESYEPGVEAPVRLM